MAIEIKVPGVGESVQEALLTEWYKKDGEAVHKDDAIFVIETDKVTLEVAAEADGVLRIAVNAGETVKIGSVVGTIEIGTEAPVAPDHAAAPESNESAEAGNHVSEAGDAPTPDLYAGPSLPGAPETDAAPAAPEAETRPGPMVPPSVRRLAAEHAVSLDQVSGTGPGGRITKGDVLLYLESRGAVGRREDAAAAAVASEPSTDEKNRREPMSPIRRRIAARLLQAKQNTAMLTTFNEIDMSQITALRERFKQLFKDTHGAALGIMSFFVKAAVSALQAYPRLNAFIEENDIVYHSEYHIGVAVGAERGLVVPVLRHADRLSYAAVESTIAEMADKARNNGLTLEDLAGGTFTISNGGVYGSLLSTPILNYPQSGILGMHKIEKRPVVIDDQVVIRPMMYVALSYDHRIVDGREAVGFLKRIKECIEAPQRMMLEV